MHGRIPAKDMALTQEEKDAQWIRRGKKYKTKYFTALKDLYGHMEKDKAPQTPQVSPISQAPQVEPVAVVEVKNQNHSYGEGWQEWGEYCCPSRWPRRERE